METETLSGVRVLAVLFPIQATTKGFSKYDQQDLPGPISFIVVVTSLSAAALSNASRAGQDQVDVVRVDSSRVKES